MTKPTPGPWGYDIEIRWENTPGEQEIHTGYWWVYTTDEANENIAKVEPLAEAQANARLFATALDMLDMLKECADEMRRIGTALSAKGQGATILGMTEKRARIVIAKAEGKTA